MPYIQDLAGVAHDDIDPSVLSISGDDQKVHCPQLYNKCKLQLLCHTLMSVSDLYKT